MDEAKIIEKHKDQEPIMELAEGGEVIGTEVDENNQLHFVVKRGEEISVEKALGKRLTPDLPDGRKKVVVSGGEIISVEKLQK